MSSQFTSQRPLHTSLDEKPGSIPNSREIGEIKAEHEKPIALRQTPFAKSWAHFVAGAIGGSTAAIATNPLDVLKTRLQSDFYQAAIASSRAARGIPPLHNLSVPRTVALHIRETFQILFAVPKVEGWRALFKGLGPNLIGVVPARAINFYTYGNGKRLISQWANDGHEAAWVHLSAAIIAGVTTGTITCPIWVVKTRLQLDKSSAEKRVGTGASAASKSSAVAAVQAQRQYKNALDCTIQTLRHEGIRGLYRGLGASYLGVSESTLQWVLYEQMKSSLARREQRIQATGREKTAWDRTIEWTGKAGSAGIAKFFAAIVTYPHEVVRTRLRQKPIHLPNGQVTVKYTGILQCVRLIYREEGLVALYGGLIPHMLRVVPSAAIMFGAYEGVLHLLGVDSNL